MNRQGQYGDSSMDSYAAQMQLASSQRVDHGSGITRFSGKPDSLPGDKKNPYISSKEEAQWLLEKDRAKGPNPLPSYDNYGDGREASRSFYRGQRPDAKVGFSKQHNKDPRAQPHEQDMNVGYRNYPLTQTVESLTLMKLIKERQGDSENARQCQDMLTALEAQHTRGRHDVLQGRQSQYPQAWMSHYQNLELQGRQSQYPQARMSHYQNMELRGRQSQYPQAWMSHYQNIAGPSDPGGYGGVASANEVMIAAAAVDARGQLDLEREREVAKYIWGDRKCGA